MEAECNVGANMLRPDADELRCYYWLFLGRDAADGDSDRDCGDTSGLLRRLIESLEFERSVLDPMRTGSAVSGGAFDNPPTAGLRQWAAERLPLTAEVASKVAAASGWDELHRAILSDSFFIDAILRPERPTAQPETPADSSPLQVANHADMEFCYRLFLGREQETSYGEDTRINLDLREVARGFIDSVEFDLRVRARSTERRALKGELFDAAPTAALRQWAAERLPLTPKGIADVSASASWWELHRSIFSDRMFIDEVLGPESPAAQLGALSPPWVPSAADRADLEFCYRLFLGREQEASRTEDTRIGLSLSEVALSFVDSIEFERVVLGRAVAGRAVRGGHFDAAPDVALRRWAAERLPLTPKGVADVRAASSWRDLHNSIFSDPLFIDEFLGPDSPAAQFAKLPPPWVPLFAELEDVKSCYRFFLGREWEAPDSEDGRIGVDLGELARSFISSSEFALTVAEPMKSGAAVATNLFGAPPSQAIRQWASERLPLSPEGASQALAVRCWYQLHRAIFADPLFIRVTGPDLPSAQLGSAPFPLSVQAGLIESSWLFERDWYLETYRDVARSGGDPLQHYLMHGVAEGRNPNRLFDTRWYLAAYPDAWSEKIHPLAHYILEGARLGYDPHPFFSTSKFREHNPAAKESELTPLAEYLHPRGPIKGDPLPTFGPYDVHKAAESIERLRERPEMERHIDLMVVRPTFIVLIDGGTTRAVEATRESLAHQIYPDVQAFCAMNRISSLESAGGETYFLWLEAGDRLHWDALYELASRLNADPGLEAIYFDHETCGPDGQIEPIHKPDWSPDYLESHNYIGSAACFEWSKAKRFLADAESRFDFLLRFTEVEPSIAHIDRVLMSCEAADDALAARQRQASEIRALKGRLARTARSGAAEPYAAGAPSYDVKVALQARPLVSIVIPTAARIIDYQGERIDLIVSCLESITEKSSYTNIEFIIVDNGDFDRDRLKHITAYPITYVTYTLPEVNIAKKINLGASLARGEFFLLMNDDIEVLASDWIERMLAHFEKSHVGVVGAKLVYPQRTIQHAGVVFCDGAPDHVRRGWPRDDEGYVFSTSGVRNYSAVTGAVSMARATDFRQVGGYSEELPIDYNDIDFCFKLRELGYFVVYEPKAELIHYESVSAVKPPRPQDAVFFYGRWAHIIEDPYYNQHCLSKHPPTFEPFYGERRS